MNRRFKSVSETRPGSQWLRLVDDYWPGWREWYLTRGGSRATGEKEGLRALRRFMPEMESLIDRLAAARPNDPVLREFLGFWCPPRYLVSCTQAASVDDNGPFLLRNYDLDPSLSEATLLHSSWKGKAVQGMVESLAGLSDGMNEDGLAVSLSFGGRIVSGKGFGIPLILRYVLETCRDVRDAVEALRLVPSHMSYNVTVVDRTGAIATAFLAPDRPTLVSQTPWATNHQLGVEWPRHGRMSATLERAQFLEQGYRDGFPGAAWLMKRFASPPFFARQYRQGYGTVYTAFYRLSTKTTRLNWGCGKGVSWQMGAVAPDPVDVEFTEAGSRIIGPSRPGWKPAAGSTNVPFVQEQT